METQKWRTHTELAKMIVAFLREKGAVREGKRVLGGYTRYELAREFQFSINEDWIPVKKIILQEVPLAYGPQGHFIGEPGEGTSNVVKARHQAIGWNRRADEYEEAVPDTAENRSYRDAYESMLAKRKEHQNGADAK